MIPESTEYPRPEQMPSTAAALVKMRVYVKSKFYPRPTMCIRYGETTLDTGELAYNLIVPVPPTHRDSDMMRDSVALACFLETGDRVTYAGRVPVRRHVIPAEAGDRSICATAEELGSPGNLIWTWEGSPTYADVERLCQGEDGLRDTLGERTPMTTEDERTAPATENRLLQQVLDELTAQRREATVLASKVESLTRANRGDVSLSRPEATGVPMEAVPQHVDELRRTLGVRVKPPVIDLRGPTPPSFFPEPRLPESRASEREPPEASQDHLSTLGRIIEESSRVLAAAIARQAEIQEKPATQSESKTTIGDGLLAPTKLREAFLADPKVKYDHVVAVVKADNAEAGIPTQTDAQEIGAWFRRTIPLSNQPRLHEFFLIAQAMHRAVEEKNYELLLGRMASLYQYIEAHAVKAPGAQQEIAWAVTHLPDKRPGEFVIAPGKHQLVRLPEPIVMSGVMKYRSDHVKWEKFEKGLHDDEEEDVKKLREEAAKARKELERLKKENEKK